MGSDFKIRGGGSVASVNNKGKATVWILLAVALLAVLIFNPVGCAFIGAFIGMGQIRIAETKLRKPEIYEPVAREDTIEMKSRIPEHEEEDYHPAATTNAVSL